MERKNKRYVFVTCSISNSIKSPERVVSEPINLLKSSEKLENIAALAATRVLILVFSSLGSRSAAGYPKVILNSRGATKTT